MNKYFIAIDIGSTCAKTVVMNHEKEILHRFLQPTGWSSVDTAKQIQETLMEKGILPEESVVVATGYGRVSVPYAAKCVTEITCHAKGACYIHKNENMLLIDIGGQDTKIIRIENGMVTDFLMNDKCSAGTGRFLEVMANTLSLTPQDLCELASKGSGTWRIKRKHCLCRYRLYRTKSCITGSKTYKRTRRMHLSYWWIVRLLLS